MKEFILEDDYIPLIQLLKVTRLAHSGGDAQYLVESGVVFLNGVLEHRKRAKIRIGDVVKCHSNEIKIVGKR